MCKKKYVQKIYVLRMYEFFVMKWYVAINRVFGKEEFIIDTVRSFGMFHQNQNSFKNAFLIMVTL